MAIGDGLDSLSDGVVNRVDRRVSVDGVTAIRDGRAAALATEVDPDSFAVSFIDSEKFVERAFAML